VVQEQTVIRLKLTVVVLARRKLDQYHRSPRLPHRFYLINRYVPIAYPADTVIRIKKDDAGFLQDALHSHGPGMTAS
jgi:hypothetical protein